MKLVPIKYVKQITQLPKTPPILLETEAKGAIFLIESSFWASLSLWLGNKVAGESLPLEAYQEPALWLEPYADYYAALFRLATETHPRTTCLDLLKFSTPADLWMRCIETSAKQGLEEAGLLGVPAQVIGKKEAYDSTRKICQQLRKLSYQPQPLPTITEDPESLLIVEAQRVAQDPSQSRFRYRHFLPFVKTLLDVAKTAYECKHLQCAYLMPNEDLLVTGLHTKLSKHKQHKALKYYERIKPEL